MVLPFITVLSPRVGVIYVNQLCVVAVLLCFASTPVLAALTPPMDNTKKKANSNRALKLGGKVGINVSQLEDGDGFGISPELAVRFAYAHNKNFAVFLDPGYLQARMPLTNGTIRADYFKNALFLVGKYPLSFFVPYVLIGGYVNVAFTGEYEDATDTYDFKDQLESVNYGLSGGLGVEFVVWRLDVFADAMISRSLSPAVKSVNSSLATISSSNDLSVQFYVGAKWAFWRMK